MLASLLLQVSLLTKEEAPFVFIKGSETLQLSYQFTEVPVATLGLQLQGVGSRLTNLHAVPACGQVLFIPRVGQ